MKLTHPSTESRIALFKFKHLSECSIEEFEKLYILRMKRATGCVDGDEIRLDMMEEAVVLAMVRCIKNKGEAEGGSGNGENVVRNGENSFCRVKLKDAKKKVK